MDLKEQQNIFSLAAGGIRLTNRTMPSILAVLVVLALVTFAVMFAGEKLNIHPIFTSLIRTCINMYASVVFWRLLAAKADNFGESVSNSMAASFLPTIYTIILALIIGAVMAVGTGIMMLLSGVFLFGILVLLALAFLALRLSFAPLAIALKEQGPVGAIIYSWELTGYCFWRLIGVSVLCLIGPLAVSVVLGLGMYITVPLYFADSFNLAALTPGWYAVLAAMALIISVSWIASMATFLLFFLNIDYGENRDSFTPIAQAQISAQTTQVFGEDNNVLPPGVGKTVQKEDVQRLSVVKASVKTGSGEEELKEHLDQVYQPRQEDTIQYAEEDRMPTILFDDETARQIEANRQMFEAKKQETQPEEEDNGQSIKMSK